MVLCSRVTSPTLWPAISDPASTSPSSQPSSTQTSIRRSIEMYCGDGVIQPPEACDPPDGSTCSATFASGQVVT